MKTRILFLGILFLMSEPGLEIPGADPVTEPDNSRINIRDQRREELTASQQGSSASDIELTRQVRREILKHHNLSTNAHNIKIITLNGIMTLKGPVASRGEMQSVETIARQVAGRQNIRNEMQIAAGE